MHKNEAEIWMLNVTGKWYKQHLNLTKVSRQKSVRSRYPVRGLEHNVFEIWHQYWARRGNQNSERSQVNWRDFIVATPIYHVMY